MKTINKLLFTMVLLTSFAGIAQNTNGSKSLRLNLYGAYAFEDSFDSYYDFGNYYQGQLQGGFQYGAGLEIGLRQNTSIEILYLRQDTNAPTQYYDGGIFDKYANFDVAMNYILLGGNKTFTRPGSKVEGFGGLMAGMALITINNPENNYDQNTTKFAWGLKGGAIIWATKKVGIKMQAQLLSVAQSIGGGVYFGPGGGGAGVSSYSSLYQFTLGGGLVFELGK